MNETFLKNGFVHIQQNSALSSIGFWCRHDSANLVLENKAGIVDLVTASLLLVAQNIFYSLSSSRGVFFS
jgi:hypothetical protein